MGIAAQVPAVVQAPGLGPERVLAPDLARDLAPGVGMVLEGLDTDLVWVLEWILAQGSGSGRVVQFQAVVLELELDRDQAWVD